MSKKSVNDHNMIIETEEVCFGTTRQACTSVAEIRVGRYGRKWFLGLSMNLPHEGFGRGVKAIESERNPAFASREEAIEAGKNEAIAWLSSRVSKGELLETHEAIALKCIQEIESSKQLSLF